MYIHTIRTQTTYSSGIIGFSGYTEAYRYGFQGQELDDEVGKGHGNSINYKYRMHDPRVGRFFAVDPLTAKYPWYTPYQFSGNKVINAVELEGLEEEVVIYNEGSTKPTIYKRSDYNTRTEFLKVVDQYLQAAILAPEYLWVEGSSPNANGTYNGDAAKPWNYKQTGTLYLTKDKDGTIHSFDYNPTPVDKRGYDPTYYDPLEGGAEAGNIDGKFYGKKGFYERGLPLMLSTAGVIFSGGGLILAEGAAATSYAGVGFVFSLDDITNGGSSENNTLLESLAEKIGGDIGKDLLNGAKFAVSMKDAGKSVVNLTVTLADGSSYSGAYNMINDVWDMVEASKTVVEKKTE